jgi:hypothetical protein
VAVVGHVEQSPQMPRLPFIEWYRPFAYDRIAAQAGKPVSYQFFWSMNLSLPRKVMLERQLVFHEDWANIGHEDVELGYRWTRGSIGPTLGASTTTPTTWPAHAVCSTAWGEDCATCRC